MGKHVAGSWLKRLILAPVCGVFLAGAANGAEIKIGGAGSALGSMRMLAKAYEESHQGVKITVFSSLGSSGGIKALLAGSLDIALSGRPLKPEEQKAGAAGREYARTPFVFAVNHSVKKDNITTAELERIYRGEMQRWPDGTQIRLVLRPESDTDTKIVKAISPALAEAAKTAASRPGMIYAVTDQDCDEALVKTPGAIGPSTLGEIMTDKRSLRILSFNGVKPSVKALAEGRYPLVKPHYVIMTAKSSAAAQDFARFLESAKARAILSRVGNLVSPEKRQ